ncbi:Intraflagellar transport protein 172-like protein [Diplonema papillatum]|nr:Intraflagellar transport protein 172-like protein [Diplonema papillatum]
MRLNFTQCSANQHKEACSAVVWSTGNELFSCGDDMVICRWNMSGEPIGKVGDLPSYPTDMAWYPQQKKGEQGKDLCVIAFADGYFRIVSAVTGRVEKAVEAHKGAMVCLAWNSEGGALATGGEDGQVKTWSQAGMLRSTVSQESRCIHALAWSPENDRVLFACGKQVHIKPLQPSTKHLHWVAHNSGVLCVDWSPVTNLIVTGAEDGKYKVWDSYGRQMFSCPTPADNAITSVSFSPDGQCVAVGSFNSLRVCDKTGWTHCRDGCNTGSIFKIAWSSDSTQLAGAGGTGAVCLAQLVDRKLSYHRFEATLREENRIRVFDVTNPESAQELEQRDKVIKMSIGYNFLVVATTTQCIIYDLDNLGSSHQFDVKATVNLILQAEKLFAIVDSINGIQMHSYEGRSVCVLKIPHLSLNTINNFCLSLSNDTFAMRDSGNTKSVKFFDTTNGRQRTDLRVEHNMEISEVALSQYGDVKERKLTIIDRNRDLYLVALTASGKTCPMQKVAAMVTSVRWNDSSEILIALADLKLVIWYYPSVVFVDRDLLPKTKTIREDGQVQVEFGWNDQIIDFFGTRTSVRRGLDGAVLTFTVSPYPNLLFKHIRTNDWEAATRLCRVVKETFMWCVLAGLAVRNGQLATAEIAYAALEEADKLQYMRYIQEIPVPEGRAAELALFQRRIDEAEQILLQAGLHFRAIKMHVNLFNWEHALELATKHMTHIDTVLAFRQAHLQTFGKEETIGAFKQRMAGDNAVNLSWERINTKIEEEAVKERKRADTKAYK